MYYIPLYHKLLKLLRYLGLGVNGLGLLNNEPYCCICGIAQD